MRDGNSPTFTTRSSRDRRRRRRQARRRLLVLVVVIVVAVVAVVAVVVVRGRGGDGGAAGDTGGTAAGVTPSQSPTPSTPPPTVWVASAGDPVRVWVGGDSMGGELGWALEPVLQDAGAFKTVTYYKESSGICRYDFFDWQQQIETVVKARNRRPP